MQQYFLLALLCIYQLCYLQCFKNWIGGKTRYASGSRFFIGFSHFFWIGLASGSQFNWLDQQVWSDF